MKVCRIATAHIDNKVGAFSENVARMQWMVLEAKALKPSMIIFQEMALTGYPCEDLIHFAGFQSQQVEHIVNFAAWCYREVPNAFVVFGASVEFNDQVFNCAIVAAKGHIVGVVPKMHLPEYSVFVDGRTFAKGCKGMQEHLGPELDNAQFGDMLFSTSDLCFAVEICEDTWATDGPMMPHALDGAEMIINISASPERIGVVDTRRRMVQQRSADAEATVVYVNAFGGNDALSFDGGGFVAQCGSLVAELPRHKESVEVTEVNLDAVHRSRMRNTTWRDMVRECRKPIARVEINAQMGRFNCFSLPRPLVRKWPPREDIVECLLTGLDGYFTKCGCFKGIVISLSGGRDSVLTTILAVLWARRTGRNVEKTVRCFSQPSRFNSEGTKSVARDIAEALGCSFVEEPITDAFNREIEALCNMLDCTEEELSPLTKQNTQARIRGSRMWNISNATGALWLQCSNLSELCTGYSTIGGDMMGSFSLLGDVKKTEINSLLEEFKECRDDQSVFWLGVDGFKAVTKCLNMDASAELADNQKDERDLMPYAVLDQVIDLYLGERMRPKDVWQVLCNNWRDVEAPQGLELWVKDFVRRFHRAVFKRQQVPECVHTQEVDVDRARTLQMPICHDISWLRLDEQWSI